MLLKEKWAFNSKNRKGRPRIDLETEEPITDRDTKYTENFDAMLDGAAFHDDPLGEGKKVDKPFPCSPLSSGN